MDMCFTKVKFLEYIMREEGIENLAFKGNNEFNRRM